jgi:hypothetical protein
MFVGSSERIRPAVFFLTVYKKHKKSSEHRYNISFLVPCAIKLQFSSVQFSSARLKSGLMPLWVSRGTFFVVPRFPSKSGLIIHKHIETCLILGALYPLVRTLFLLAGPCHYIGKALKAPSKSGLMNKHIVKHEQTYREIYRDYVSMGVWGEIQNLPVHFAWASVLLLWLLHRSGVLCCDCCRTCSGSARGRDRVAYV